MYISIALRDCEKNNNNGKSSIVDVGGASRGRRPNSTGTEVHFKARI